MCVQTLGTCAQEIITVVTFVVCVCVMSLSFARSQTLYYKLNIPQLAFCEISCLFFFYLQIICLLKWSISQAILVCPDFWRTSHQFCAYGSTALEWCMAALQGGGSSMLFM